MNARHTVELFQGMLFLQRSAAKPRQQSAAQLPWYRLLTGKVETLAARVDEHLKKMGAVWK